MGERPLTLSRIDFPTHRLLFNCVQVLVGLYFTNMIIHLALPSDHWLRFSSLEMSCDTLADVLTKVMYTRILVDSYQSVFATDLRTMRQLSELKQLMSLLWASSSDVIVISTKVSAHKNVTMLSPSYLALVGSEPPKMALNADGYQKAPALALETDRGKLKSAYYVDTSILSGGAPNLDNQLLHIDLEDNVIQQALRITNAAWATRNSQRLNEPLRTISINCKEDSSRDSKDSNQKGAATKSSGEDNGDGSKIICEMKVSGFNKQTAVAVVRDVTERYRRFEAESRAHTETIARQRDMHTANRFTRHEVKNGLLSGIELCHTLGQSLDEISSNMDTGKGATSGGSHEEKLALLQTMVKQSTSLLNDSTRKTLSELDGALHEVLDTVLAEVMAREVVHGVYQPKLEELDVTSMLVSSLGTRNNRLHVSVKDGEIPKLMMDSQLLGHIHRNAVSNACKYGRSDGQVETLLKYDASTLTFTLEVTNEPGLGHDSLMAMGSSANDFIFAQGVRLQPHMKGNKEQKLDSSGDGAW